jgi:hypothetical protein
VDVSEVELLAVELPQDTLKIDAMTIMKNIAISLHLKIGTFPSLSHFPPAQI